MGRHVSCRRRPNPRLQSPGQDAPPPLAIMSTDMFDVGVLILTYCHHRLVVRVYGICRISCSCCRNESPLACFAQLEHGSVSIAVYFGGTPARQDAPAENSSVILQLSTASSNCGCCCCCFHINSNNQVRDHRAGSIPSVEWKDNEGKR